MLAQRRRPRLTQAVFVHELEPVVHDGVALASSHCLFVSSVAHSVSSGMPSG